MIYFHLSLEFGLQDWSNKKFKTILTLFFLPNPLKSSKNYHEKSEHSSAVPEAFLLYKL